MNEVESIVAYLRAAASHSAGLWKKARESNGEFSPTAEYWRGSMNDLSIAADSIENGEHRAEEGP